MCGPTGRGLTFLEDAMEQSGMTIGDIFRIIFRRKWWVTGVTVLVLVVAVLLVQFWYNPMDRVYTLSYTIRTPESSQGLYPDGTVLRPEDSILLPNLEDVKSEKYTAEDERTGEFSDIDIVSMVDKDGITLTSTVPVVTEETTVVEPTVYTLTAEAKYFKNSDQARHFLRAVAEYPVNTAKEIVHGMGYSFYITLSDTATTYEDKIDYLVSQRDYLSNLYNTIRDKFGASYRPLGPADKTIGNYIEELSTVFDTRVQNAYYNTVTANYYVYDTDNYEATSSATIAATRLEIDNNNAIIAALEEKIVQLQQDGHDLGQIDAYDVLIAQYVEKNAQLEIEIANLEEAANRIELYSDPSTAEGKAKAEFDAQLLSTRDRLAELTEGAKALNIATYDRESRIQYVNNAIKVDGGMNVVLAGLLGAVFGFIVVSVVVLIADTPAYKRQKQDGEN